MVGEGEGQRLILSASCNIRSLGKVVGGRGKQRAASSRQKKARQDLLEVLDQVTPTGSAPISSYPPRNEDTGFSP